MSNTIAPVMGDWIMSPSGKKWRVMQVRDYGYETVYELRRASDNPKRMGQKREVYLREIAHWKRSEGNTND